MSQDVRPEAATQHVPAAPTGPAGYGPPGPGYGPGYGPPVPGYGPPVPGYGPPAGPARRTEGTAIAALACGFFVAPVGVVLGIVALRRIRRHGTAGRGLAIGGIAVGAVATLSAIALVVGLVALVSSGVGGSSTTRCSAGTCETTVHGTPISIDEVGGETLGERFVVVSVEEGAVSVQAEPDPAPTRIPAGETFTVDAEPVTVVSASDGTAVFRYRH